MISYCTPDLCLSHNFVNLDLQMNLLSFQYFELTQKLFGFVPSLVFSAFDLRSIVSRWVFRKVSVSLCGVFQVFFLDTFLFPSFGVIFVTAVEYGFAVMSRRPPSHFMILLESLVLRAFLRCLLSLLSLAVFLVLPGPVGKLYSIQIFMNLLFVFPGPRCGKPHYSVVGREENFSLLSILLHRFHLVHIQWSMLITFPLTYHHSA